MRTHPCTILAVAAALALGSSCRSTYYSTMEKFGVHKRDILVDRVEEGREEQEAAKEQFQTTYERFKELTGVDGGELEDVYERLNDEYEDCDDRAAAVRERIDSIESVAADLFSEWKGELDEISSPDLRKKSAMQLDETRSRYERLITAMKQAESRMEPVLVAFRDQVLFLKHNLNAQAISSLQTTVIEIEDDVTKLIEEMKQSIAEADAFIASMETPQS
jgi:hypothetical protein